LQLPGYFLHFDKVESCCKLYFFNKEHNLISCLGIGSKGFIAEAIRLLDGKMACGHKLKTPLATLVVWVAPG